MRGKRNNTLRPILREAKDGLRYLEQSPLMQQRALRKMVLKAAIKGPAALNELRKVHQIEGEYLNLTKLTAEEIAKIPWQEYKSPGIGFGTIDLTDTLALVDFSGSDFSYFTSLLNPYKKIDEYSVATLAYCKLQDTQWNKQYSGLDAIDFTNADLTRANFSGMTFSQCLFHQTRVQGADFSNAMFDWFHPLYFKDASGAKFVATKFGSATIILEGEAKDIDFSDADFSQTRLRNASFESCKFEGAKWDNTSIKNCLFANCDFKNPSSGTAPRFFKEMLDPDKPNHGITDEMIREY